MVNTDHFAMGENLTSASRFDPRCQDALAKDRSLSHRPVGMSRGRSIDKSGYKNRGVRGAWGKGRGRWRMKRAKEPFCSMTFDNSTIAFAATREYQIPPMREQQDELVVENSL